MAIYRYIHEFRKGPPQWEIGGLTTSSAETVCNNLTMIFMDGESGDMIYDRKTLHCIPTMEWFMQETHHENI